MNGIKLKKNKNKNNIKLIISVLLSNFFLYFLMSTSKDELILKKDHTLIKLPLETFVPLSGAPSISLYSPLKIKIINTAYLHNKLANGDPLEGRFPTYEVEVANSELTKLINLRSKYLLAYPANHLKKEQSNEIVF